MGLSTQQDRDRLFNILYLKEMKELPTWMLEIRKENVTEKLPVFSYYADDYMEYELDVYANGDVKIVFGSTNNGFPGHEAGNVSFVDMQKNQFLKVSPKKVRVFLAELKKIGFYNWELNNDVFTFCDKPDATQCIRKRYQVTLRNDRKNQRVYFAGLAGFVEEKSMVSERFVAVSALVEKHFSTQSLRCGLGASEEFKQACIKRDKHIANLAKEESKNGNK